MEELYFKECCRLNPFQSLHKKISEKEVRGKVSINKRGKVNINNHG